MGNLFSYLACSCFRSTTEKSDKNKLQITKMPLLHGRLAFFIDRAEGLPDTDTAFWNIDRKDVTDPFVSGEIGPTWLFRTRYINNSLDPVWEEKFSIPVCQDSEEIILNVRDKEHVGSSPVASLTISCEEVLQGDEIEGWYDLTDANGEGQGRIKLSVQFFPKDEEERLGKGVPDAYFPVRENNRFTLYQDADTPRLRRGDNLVLILYKNIQ